MAGKPWFKMYGSDWQGDPRLRMCSLGARGLWLEMIIIMEEADPKGHLMVHGISPNERQLAQAVGGPIDEVKAYLEELETLGVFSRNRNGVIYSRRITRDEKRSKTATKNGKKGGNPALKTYENDDLLSDGKQKGNSSSVNQNEKKQDKGKNQTDLSPNGYIPESRVQKEDIFSSVSTTSLFPETESPTPPLSDSASAKSNDGFEVFWKTYSRKNDNKASARKSWAKAIRKATPEQITQAAAAYIASLEPDKRHGPYQAMASTWLNQDRFLDSYEPYGKQGQGRPTGYQG